MKFEICQDMYIGTRRGCLMTQKHIVTLSLYVFLIYRALSVILAHTGILPQDRLCCAAPFRHCMPCSAAMLTISCV